MKKKMRWCLTIILYIVLLPFYWIYIFVSNMNAHWY